MIKKKIAKSFPQIEKGVNHPNSGNSENSKQNKPKYTLTHFVIKMGQIKYQEKNHESSNRKANSPQLVSETTEGYHQICN